MGHGSRGSWNSLLMSQMGHGSQNLTHSQLWNRPHGNYRRGLQCQKPFTVSLSPLMQHSVGFCDLCYTKNNIRELDRRESFWFFGQFGSFCADVTPADTQKLSCRWTSAAEKTNAGPRNCWMDHTAYFRSHMQFCVQYLCLSISVTKVCVARLQAIFMFHNRLMYNWWPST